MPIRLLMVFSFIFHCLKIKTNPARYFQINAPYFNPHKGIFSKLDIDQLIPKAWRLTQCLDNGQSRDFNYPVFIKPEWGQNGCGIRRVDSAEELNQLRHNFKQLPIPNIIQEAATEAREFEIFFIRCAMDKTLPAVLTVTEALSKDNQLLPIHSINNENTHYHELTDELNPEQLARIWDHVKSLGSFGISRVAVRADSVQAMVSGEFHIIEINLFVPMPINLLDPDKTPMQRLSFVLAAMSSLAEIVKAIPEDQVHMPVFFKKWQKSRQLKTLALPQ